jgi:dynein heavy chain
LSRYDLPGFYSTEEVNQIKEELQERIKDSNVILVDPLEIFMEKVRDNVHVIACITPGDSLQKILTAYPSFASQFTINWVSEWGEEALAEIASTRVNFASDFLREPLTKAIVAVHNSAVDQSHAMYSEARRVAHVTPSNYMSFVTNYNSLMKTKGADIQSTINKLRNGLSKLDETRTNVDVLSDELQISKQQITQYQKQCEEFLGKMIPGNVSDFHSRHCSTAPRSRRTNQVRCGQE